MNNRKTVKDLGELNLIKIIEELILEKTGKTLIRDDSFFFDIDEGKEKQELVLNSDMLVSTTDMPKQASYYQIGRKAVIMNVSDLIVKNVKPRAIIISLGLFNEIKLTEFKELISGIIDTSIRFNLDYIGGDINETKELIINPTVLGWQKQSGIIFRKGINTGDFIVINKKFGLTGVGFNILINRSGDIDSYPEFNKSILSVLEPDLSEEAYLIAKAHLASASIDSSDGLTKSLNDLMLSNPNIGFEIDFNENLFEKEAVKYSQEFNIPLESLVFDAGEEFIHIFTISPKDFNSAQDLVKSHGGQIFKIGRVISEEKIFLLKEGKKLELKSRGFEHFK